MVLFSAILARMDVSGDSASDQTFLGWLLIAFVVPGYVTMAWQCVKSYLDVFYDAYNEAKKTKGEVKELGAACGGCLKSGTAATEGRSQGRAQRRRSSSAQLQDILKGNAVAVTAEGDGSANPFEDGATLPSRDPLDASGVQAMYDEAFAYHHGQGVPENLERARGIYMQICAGFGKLAAKQGEVSVAEERRDGLYAKLKATGGRDNSTLHRAIAGAIDEHAELVDERRVLERTPQHLDALNNLAAMCTRGEGGPRDYARALELWEVSSNPHSRIINEYPIHPPPLTLLRRLAQRRATLSPYSAAA